MWFWTSSCIWLKPWVFWTALQTRTAVVSSQNVDSACVLLTVLSSPCCTFQTPYISSVACAEEVHLRTEWQMCPHWEMNQIARGIARGHCCRPRDFCENLTWLLRPHGGGLTVEWGVIILLPASAPHANMPERPVSKRYHTIPLTLCQGDCPRAPYPRLRCVDWNRAGHTSPTGRINCFSFGKT